MAQHSLRFTDLRDFKGGTARYGIFTSKYSFEETIARLVTLSGQTPFENIDDKVWFEFVGQFNGVTFTVYDYCGDEFIHVGGEVMIKAGDRSLDYLAFIPELERLLDTVEPTPFRAKGLDGNVYEWRKAVA